jgi:hypothetical protein
LDDILQIKGLHLASPCSCCKSGETSHHIFSARPIAYQVWDFFAAAFGVNDNHHQLLHLLFNSWEILKHRKANRFEGTPLLSSPKGLEVKLNR